MNESFCPRTKKEQLERDLRLEGEQQHLYYLYQQERLMVRQIHPKTVYSLRNLENQTELKIITTEIRRVVQNQKNVARLWRSFLFVPYFTI